MFSRTGTKQREPEQEKPTSSKKGKSKQRRTEKAVHSEDDRLKQMMMEMFKDFQGEASQTPRPFETKNSPLTTDILSTHLPKNFKVPTFESFSDKSYPETHTTKFVNYMQLYNASDRLLCKVFPTTLVGTAQKWYSRLPPGSITTWKDLSTKFILRFFSQHTAKEKLRTALPMQTKGERAFKGVP